MSFHVSHGLFGRLMCSCCFSAERIRVAHHKAIRFNLYEQDHSEADPIAELRREAHQEQKQEQKVAFEKVRRTSMMSAAVDAAKFAETLRNTRERNKTEMLKESLLSTNQREKGSSMASISENSDENSDESSDTLAPLGSSKKVSFANKFKKISLKGAARHFVRQYTAPSIEVDPIKLHRFDTHKLDYDHENHRPKYRWKYDEELSDWVEIPVGAAGGRAHCCIGKEDMTHHQQLFFFGKYHRHFLFNYVRMSLLLLAVYMGVFIIQFGQSVLKHFNPESEEERTYKDLVTPIIFFVFAMIPVIVHDTLLPDIVAKIVQTTKTEQMIDTKHVQRVLGMMKAKNALMVLHNMSSFMHHIDEEAHTANLLAQEVLKGMEGMESLSEKETTALLGRCVPITCRKGERIVEAGTSANSMYIVLEGSVGFTLINTKHGKTDVVEAGSFFGSRSMITGSKTDYNAKALHKVLLFKLTHDDARTHLPDHVWEGLVARAEAEAKQIAEGGRSLTSMRSMRKQSITSLIRSNSITPPPKKKQRHRHLKSALQMLRELAMHSTFDSIDEDGGGTVSTEELSSFFSKLFPINHPYHLFHVDQINILGKELDVSGDNEIDEKDFHDYMMPIIVREDTIGDPEESARRMFNILDEQGSEGANGKVTTKKFKDLLNLFGMSMSFEEVRELFHE
jgi:Ca2+-binding EF-hand superfamily protein